MKVKVTISRKLDDQGSRAKYTAKFETLDGSPFGTIDILSSEGNCWKGTVVKGKPTYNNCRTVSIYSHCLEDLDLRIENSIDGLRQACTQERRFQAELPAIPDPMTYCL